MSRLVAGASASPTSERSSAPGRPGATQWTNNARHWVTGRYVDQYDHGALNAAEVVILARHGAALSGRVLDIGCGAGRVLRYLALLGDDVHGIDLSAGMVARARRRLPGVDVHVGDMRRLGDTEAGDFDAIVIPDNTLDVFGDAQRHAILRDLLGRLRPSGLLAFSSHNLDGYDALVTAPPPPPLRRAKQYLRDVRVAADGTSVRSALAPVIAWRNRRRLSGLQYRGHEHAVLNDPTHRWAMLHYHVTAQAQRHALQELGFECLEVLEPDGTAVPGDRAGRGPWLYYVARSLADGR